jgi:hypothetical protein
MASMNGVAGRIEVRGACSLEELCRLPNADIALLCDCEGAEKVLLDPVRVPTMRRWRVLVELHDFIDPTISAAVLSRFEASHTVELIHSRDQTVNPPAELGFLSERQRRMTISENRPGPMRWAHLHPRAHAR